MAHLPDLQHVQDCRFVANVGSTFMLRAERWWDGRSLATGGETRKIVPEAPA
jgi:hypothetical protein